MKTSTIRNLLFATLGIAIAAPVMAVHLDPGGRGQVLLYPYYTVNKGQQTLLSVTNTSSVAQAARVRFREGYNGREVLSLNVFLSPFDSWSGTIFALSDAGIESEGAAILSRDTSCTAPFFSEDGTSIGGTPYVSFRDFAYLTPDDGGPYTMDRTREGMFEIIAMSNVDAPLASAIAHGSNGSPPTGCAQVRTLLGTEPALSSAPSGGLTGSVSIINAGQGTHLSFRAEALGGFTGLTLFPLVQFDGDLPNLSSVNDGPGAVLSNQATAHVFDAKGVVQNLTYPGPDPRSRRVDAVTAVLMADRIHNDYQIGTATSRASDWVVTMPTKAFYVDRLYVGATATSAVPPFTRIYNGSPSAIPRFAAVAYSRTLYSHEGISAGSFGGCGFVCTPGFPPPPSFTRNVNVIPIKPNVVAESSVLGSTLVSTIARFPGERTWQDSGSMSVNLDPPVEKHALLNSAEGKQLRGLPMIGFWASNFVSSKFADSAQANYATAVKHSSSVTCVNGSNGTRCD